MHSQIRWALVVTIGLTAGRSAAAGEFTLAVMPDRVLPGEIVSVSWTAPEGETSSSDWIGMYRVGDNNFQYLTYQYTGGAIAGEMDFSAPNAVGSFEFRYLLMNGYTHVSVSNVLEVSCSGEIVVGGPKVLMLSGGGLPSDCAGLRVLEASGFDATPGPTVPAWDGSQFDLNEFAAVVLPHNVNWSSGMNEAGIAALAGFVREGGGLVTGEWALWGAFSRGQTSFLELAPIEDYCGFNYVDATTYTQATADPVIHDGVPGSFTFPLAYLAGTESCFGARPEATVFFTSSNGGGTSGADGLVGWNYGRGRVASFSTLITDVELANNDYATLFANTVAWVQRGACTADAATPGTLAAFVACLAGPDVVFDAGCEPSDTNCNGRVDLRDAALFQRTYEVP